MTRSLLPEDRPPPTLGLTFPKESFIFSYRKNVTFLLSFDFASSKQNLGWILPMIMIKEIMCISQFDVPHKI